MRRSRIELLILIAASVGLADLASGSRTMAQQPFGFLFGGHSRHRSRLPRRDASRAPRAIEVDVPQPIARPHFAVDAAAPTPKPALPAAPPERPAAVAPPAVAPSGAKLDDAPRQPAQDTSCIGRLKARNVDVEATAIGPQPDPRCTVVDAVRLNGLTLPDGGKIEFPDRPTIACTTADTFSLYVRDLLAPLAKGTFGASIAAVSTGPGLECRSRDHIVGAKLSAHGQGLAIDIAQLKLSTGRVLAIGAPANDADTGFEAASRAAGCGYFHTVLGPGSDSYHRNHWHFDLEVRGAKGTSKFCQ